MPVDREIWAKARLALEQKLVWELGLTAAQAAEFLLQWSERSYAKGDYLCEAGAHERFFHRVVAGVQRMIYVDPAGQEYTLAFSYAGEWSGMYQSLLLDQPSEVALVCMTPTKCLSVSRENWLAACDRWPAIERWGHRFVTRMLGGRLQRETELLQLSAPARLARFSSRSSHLFLQIPHKYIAAYLGMSPETLSRLRAEVASS